MKHVLIYILMAMLLVSCATAKTASEGSDPKKATMNKAMESMGKGIEAQEDGDIDKAQKAFGEACRYLREVNADNRVIMGNASEQLKKVVEISGFEYAKKESFSLLLLYLDMQKAYADNDASTLRSLSITFNTAYQEVQQKTAEEKQKRLEEIGSEISQKREEIQKQAEPALLEVYPIIYVVKKGDTLPSIAARHEIYNDSFMWPLIYKANRDQIKDPKELYVGQDLKIPREISTEETIEARREAGAPEPEKIPKDAYQPRGKRK
jgi:nucleoid-associated protein YgaU